MPLWVGRGFSHLAKKIEKIPENQQRFSDSPPQIGFEIGRTPLLALLLEMCRGYNSRSNDNMREEGGGDAF